PSRAGGDVTSQAGRHRRAPQGRQAGRLRRPRPGRDRARPGVTGQPIKPSIEARLTTAGLPPLPRTAWLELDLDALTANLATLRVLAGPGVPIRPVVKADAYGHGALPILVLYPVPGTWLDVAREHAIDVTAGDPALLERLLAAPDGAPVLGVQL